MSTKYLEECVSSHSDTGSDTGYIAMVIVSVLCLILLGFIAFEKCGLKMKSMLTGKRASCETKIDKTINKE